MLKKEFKRGDEVRIVSIERSKQYGTNSIMKDMINRVFSIQSCNGMAVSLKGYYFHMDDITHIDNSKPIEPIPQIFCFDEKRLDI